MSNYKFFEVRMLPTEAVIRSSAASAAKWKLFGQTFIERNIRILRQSGIFRIYLNLNDSDRYYFDNSVKKHLSGLDGIEIFYGTPETGRYILLEANHFILFGTYSKFEENFILLNGIYQPVKKPNQFAIKDNGDFAEARKIAIEAIRTGSGGKLAQNINKRISIPLSLLLSRFRVLPNVITVVNFFFGVAAVVLILSNRAVDQAIGGILVQLASIVDGCDGEVARMTTRFSKLGGLLDTVSDQLLAAALIAAALVKVYIHFSPAVFWFNMIGVVSGVGLMVGIIIYFMKRYTESMSFASYNREFVDTLPKNDFFAQLLRYCQYLARKELYSMTVCLFCLFGALHYYMVFFTFVAILGSLLMLFLAFRYFPGMKTVKK